MNDGYFNIEHDIAIINDGGFFCHTCLVSRPAAEKSCDIRYCQSCYEFLVQEARLISTTRCLGLTHNNETSIHLSQKQSPLPDEVSTEGEGFVTAPVNITGAVKNGGGRPRKLIPIQLVFDLSHDGLSTRGIADELLKLGHEPISHQTVARVLASRR